MKIILDPGSCHLGKWENIKVLCDLAKEVGADSIKWQLFKLSLQSDDENKMLAAIKTERMLKNNSCNIPFPRNLWFDTVAYCRKIGLDVFASVFDTEAVDLVGQAEIKKIKLAYSQAFNLPLLKYIRSKDFEIWASGNDNNYPHYADVKLYCIPEYPPIRWSLLDKTGTMSGENWDGFSSHLIGYQSDIKILSWTKWQIIEKHFCLGLPEDNTPDSMFALNPEELKKWVKGIRGIR